MKVACFLSVTMAVGWSSIVYDMPLPSVKEQVELWSSHGVVICAHGAGLMNLLFMPPMGAVIEVFPNQFHHNLYSALAVMMGVGHYPVHPSSGAPMWATEKVRSTRAVWCCPRHYC
jgi:capsular polysaccharide biosynthesis protein